MKRLHFWDALTNYYAYVIDRIYYNNKTETTVVVWVNGDKTKVQISDGDFCNIYNSVSAAFMKRKYGSNSAFKKNVKNVLGGYNEVAYLTLARAEACDLCGRTYEEFKEMVDEKLIFSAKKK